MRQGELAAQEGAAEVEGDLLSPLSLGHALRTARTRAADIVDQDVEPAKGGDAGLHHPRHVLGRRDIGDMRPGIAAFAMDDGQRFLHRFGADVHGQHRGALPGEKRRSGLAVAPPWSRRPGAGDNGDLSVKPQHLCFFRLPWPASRLRRPGPRRGCRPFPG